jgi:hypothetical protein
MRVGISLTSNHPDVKDPRQGARWMIERAAVARRPPIIRTRRCSGGFSLSGRGADRVFVPAPVMAPGACSRADRDTGRHRAGAFHYAMRARPGRGPVRRDGRPHQDAPFSV